MTWLVFGALLGGEKYVREYVNILQSDSSQDQAPKKFVITRQDIVDWTKALGDEDITVSEKTEDPQMPHSLRWKNRTFALAYGTDIGVLLIARIHDDYAQELSKTHRVDRSKFPKGPCWWAIPINQTWTSKQEVLEVLTQAITHTKSKTVKASA